MSESDTTSSPAESFEFVVNDSVIEQKENILISPSLSSTSTDCNLEELNEEFRMESEFKEKLDISSEKQFIEEPNQQQIINKIDHLDSFDNQKLQEALNMQIQLNQQQLNQLPNLQQSQIKVEQTLTSQFIQPPMLQNQLNAQQLQQLNQNLQQVQQSKQLSQSNSENKLNEKIEQNNITSSTSSNEIARLTSPIANFDPSALFGWFSKPSQDFINKVSENTVSAFNSVLITLDPQMKEIRYAGGPSILVTSNQSFDICSVRDGFLDVFKKATVKSIDTFLSLETAIQLVGYSTAHKISLERIKGLRSNISIVPQNQIIVSIENFLYNFDDKWFDSDYLLLDDPLNKIQIAVHTQGTPLNDKYVQQLKSNRTHKFRDDGFSVRVDSLIAADLNCSIGDWHKKYVGFDKSKLHYQAVLLLSNLYKNQLQAIGRFNE